MIHYFYGTLQVGIGQTLCSFEHVSCSPKIFPYISITVLNVQRYCSSLYGVIAVVA